MTDHTMRLSGLEPFNVNDGSLFMASHEMIEAVTDPFGQRQDVAQRCGCQRPADRVE